MDEFDLWYRRSPSDNQRYELVIYSRKSKTNPSHKCTILIYNIEIEEGNSGIRYFVVRRCKSQIRHRPSDSIHVSMYHGNNAQENLHQIELKSKGFTDYRRCKNWWEKNSHKDQPWKNYAIIHIWVKN